MADVVKHIVVDTDVFEWLRALAAPGETPNTVLRRVAGLPFKPQGRKSPILKPYQEDQ